MSETETDAPSKQDPVQQHVDTVIADLGKRLVREPDKGRLRKALDTADRPGTDRDVSDAALGRISRGL